MCSDLDYDDLDYDFPSSSGLESYKWGLEEGFPRRLVNKWV